MFTKKDIFPLKLAMERDGELSHGAARLGLLVCSYIYNDEQLKFRPHEPFALPWTLASKLCFGMCQKQIYRCLRELVHHGYLIFESNGDRNMAFFSLALFRFSSDKNVHTSRDKNVRISSDKCDIANSDKTSRASSDKKGSPLYRVIPSEEIAKANEGRNSSLRSEKRGELNAASPEKKVLDGTAAAPQKLTPEQMKKHWDKAKSQLDSTLKPTQSAATEAVNSKAIAGKAKTLLRKKS